MSVCLCFPPSFLWTLKIILTPLFYSQIELYNFRKGVDVKVEVSHTLFDLERIFDSNGGKAPLTYQRFQTVFSQLGPPAKAKPAPESLGCKTPDRTEEFDVPRTLQVSDLSFCDGQTHNQWLIH